MPGTCELIFLLFPQSRSQSPRVFWSALTKRHVGSGNEIDVPVIFELIVFQNNYNSRVVQIFTINIAIKVT